MSLSSVLVITASAISPSPSPSPTGTVTNDTAPTLGSTYVLFVVIAIGLSAWWFFRTRDGRSPHGPRGQD